MTKPARAQKRRCWRRFRSAAWQPDEVAHAVAFCVAAGGYVTGAELHVNGGMYMN